MSASRRRRIGLRTQRKALMRRIVLPTGTLSLTAMMAASERLLLGVREQIMHEALAALGPPVSASEAGRQFAAADFYRRLDTAWKSP